MTTFLSAAIAYHGQAGAWDEIALIAAGVIIVAILLAVLWRARRFEPEYEDEEPKGATSDRRYEK